MPGPLERSVAGRRPVVLFGMAHAGFFRNFEDVIGLLRDTGVDVHVHFSKMHESIRLDDYSLEENGPGVLRITIEKKQSGTSGLLWAERTRVVRDIIHYSRPQYRAATDLRNRFHELQKEATLSSGARRMVQTLCDVDVLRLGRVAERVLTWLDHVIPPAEACTRVIDELRPDLVIVTPLVNFGSREVDLVKAAHRRGISTLLAVASWDNLTNKGVIKIMPDHVAVWNRAMAAEAMTLHRVPKQRIWVTGAPPFDQWFMRTPSRDRTTFCRALGLKPDRPLVVYLCSSRAIAGTAEYLVVKDWLSAIRESDHALLAGAQVLIRPHPMELHGWLKMIPDPAPEVAWRNGAAIWPTQLRHPTTEESRADFFDTLYHADAVVGLNTSAMIEAAILSKPVLTFFGHNAVASQTGNLHFRHLASDGFMLQACDLDEHAGQLASVLHDASSVRASSMRFVKLFVHPEISARENIFINGPCGQKVSASATLVRQILEVIGLPQGADGDDRPRGES